MNALRARHVFLGARGWLSPGEVVWDRAGRIAAVRRARGGPVRDLMVLPGLVDAHVHLQLSPLARPEHRFVPWVRAVMAARVGRTAAEDRAAAVDALRRLRAEGTTAVGEIDSTGRSPAALRRVALAGRCYQELTGFHLDAAGARERIAERAAPSAPGSAIAAGLSPHAPYSASAALIRAARTAGRYLAIHCAEVPEEQEFLRTGRGPFAELLAELGRLPAAFRPPGVGAVRHLAALGVLGPRTQLVHCQELERGDAERIARSGSPVAVCPGTMAWFGRTPPPVPDWLRRGIRVALGTDSRASNTALSMRSELLRAVRCWPQVSPRELLRMATEHGAASLGRPDLGRIARGRRADFCLVAEPGDDPDRALAGFVAGHGAVQSVWVGGLRVEPRGTHP